MEENLIKLKEITKDRKFSNLALITEYYTESNEVASQVIDSTGKIEIELMDNVIFIINRNTNVITEIEFESKMDSIHYFMKYTGTKPYYQNDYNIMYSLLTKLQSINSLSSTEELSKIVMNMYDIDIKLVINLINKLESNE